MSLLEIMPYLAISFGGYEYLKERLPRYEYLKERLPRADDEYLKERLPWAYDDGGAGRWSAVRAAPPAPCLVCRVVDIAAAGCRIRAGCGRSSVAAGSPA